MKRIVLQLIDEPEGSEKKDAQLQVPVETFNEDEVRAAASGLIDSMVSLGHLKEGNL